MASVEVTGPLNAVGIGQTMQLTAIARDSLNAAIANAAITWTTSSAARASVSNTGLVQGVSTGSVTITASAGGKAATWDIAVRDSASLPRTLSGRVERVNATLSGTYTVTGDFVLMADSAIRVNARILVAPGASLTLWADERLELSGSIELDSSAVAVQRTSRLTSTREIALPDTHEPGIYVGLGGRTVLARGERVYTGCPIALTGYVGQEPDLKIENSEFSASPGRPGTKAVPRGGPGCTVEIGTPEAQRIIRDKTGEATRSWTQFSVIDSHIAGGSGGDGYSLSTPDGRIADNRWEGMAGDGGKGGHVSIESGSVEILRSTVRPGSGGAGGHIDVMLRDGSGPNGEGESLLGVTGSAGGAGDLFLITPRLIAADKLSEAQQSPPGGAHVTGGNGRIGGGGGQLKLIIGNPGNRGEFTIPQGTVVTPPVAATLRTVSILNAANGGDGTNEFEPGGNGGDITFEPLLTFGPVYLRAIDLTNTTNGGLGFNGCAVQPTPRNGSNGGMGGAIRRKQVPMTESGSFNGGNGGPGVQISGKGGDRGRDVDGGVPVGRRGFDPMPCPHLFDFSALPASFQHYAGQTSCPQLVASSTITNRTLTAINYNATVSGSAALAWGNASGTLQPGGSAVLPLSFNCSTNVSFNATLRVSATAANGASQAVTSAIAAQIFIRAVKLNHALGPYAAGTVIPLSRIANGRFNPAHAPFCDVDHLHAQSAAGIGIADANTGMISGPYLDPDVGGCGYGAIIFIPNPAVAARERP